MLQRCVGEYFEGRRARRGGLKFVDLFCGIGGASTGAMDAGYGVVLAVDSCPKAISVHRANHPRCAHLQLELPPPPGTVLPLPGAHENWHCHGSPPCTKLSHANRVSASQEGREEGLALVRWYVDFATASSAATWSLEQVATPPVLRLMEELERAHPARFAWRAFWLYDLGVPQRRRRRVIAGSPEVVARLERAPTLHRSVRDVIPQPRGTHIRNQCSNIRTKYTADGERYMIPAGRDDLCAPVEGPSHTVLSYTALRWRNKGTDDPYEFLTPAEAAALQTFPIGYHLHEVRCHAYRGVGNALPPVVATQMLTDEPRNVSPSLRWRPPPAA